MIYEILTPKEQVIAREQLREALRKMEEAMALHPKFQVHPRILARKKEKKDT
jgi:hypothetical protein